jgi:uncharacterized protein (TIGR02284 family)
MDNKQIVVEMLSDLIKINNDRITGYQKAAQQTTPIDEDLQVIFHKMADESRTYVGELNQKIATLGGDAVSDTTASGKIYRLWLGIKRLFSGSDRQSLLSSCEFGEDAAQKAYDEALHTKAEMETATVQLIIDQKNRLKNSYDLIKKYRDMHVAVSS